jgi:SAM-dependent methyltransferase
MGSPDRNIAPPDLEPRSRNLAHRHVDPVSFGSSLGGVVRRPATTGATAAAPPIPDYLTRIYSWAYLWPRTVALLDRPLVVSTILWGNYRRLLRATLDELRPGQRVLQPACVYGDFSQRVAAHLGPRGHLDVTDVAPLQVRNCRRKLEGSRNAVVRLRDAAEHGGTDHDAVCCFFLLHELPADYKRRVVDALLAAVRPGGKVVFVDYHRPHWAHPLKAAMRLVFAALEPFARELWDQEIPGYASRAEDFTWSKRCYFGGLYQKTVAQRRRP